MARSFSALLLLACLGCVLTAHAGRKDESQEMTPSLSWDPPSFCRNKQCPEYSVVQSAGDVELRRYKPAHWIMVNITNTTWDDGYQSGYNKLKEYVKGGNEQGVTLPSTNPSLTIFYPAKEGAAFEALYTIEYFVPYEHQDAPPAPTADELDIIHIPEQQVWVKTFGGYAHEADIIKQAFDFIASLEQQGHTDLDKTWVGYAQYDSPARVVDRHNEVWAFVKQAPSAKAGAGAGHTVPKKCGSSGVWGRMTNSFRWLFAARKKEETEP